MLYMFSFNVKEGRMQEYQAWTKKNEDLLQSHAPKGWKYRGTYAYVLGFGRYAAAQLWECNKYGDFDTWREHKDETWNRVIMESQDYTTPESGEAVLLREIGDTRVIEKPRMEEEKARRAK